MNSQQLCIIKLQIIGKQHPMSLLLALLSTLFLLTFSERLAPESTVSSVGFRIDLPHVQPISLSFQQFKSKYGKQYSSVSQESYRLHIFQANLKRLNNHHRNSSRTYNMQVNQFLDISSSQFKETFTGAKRSDNHSRNVSKNCLKKRGKKGNRQPKTIVENSAAANKSIQNNTEILINATEKNEVNPQARLLVAANTPTAVLPKNLSIDWSTYTGSIKYQGLCGACYAFSSADTFAAMNAIKKYSFFVPLSVQQVIDCVDNGLTFGCNGGYLQGAFTYMQLNGVTTQQAYPYQSANSGRAGKCQKAGGQFRLNSFNAIPEGDCNSVIKSLQLGPVSAGIAGYNLQFYETGIFNDCNQVLDHAVVIVGYSSGKGWRIKNSWGTSWGQSGYGWIAQGNTCGICNMAVSVAV